MKTSFEETGHLIELVREGNEENVAAYIDDPKLACNADYFPYFEAVRALADRHLGRWPEDAVRYHNIFDLFKTDPQLKAEFGSPENFIKQLSETVNWVEPSFNSPESVMKNGIMTAQSNVIFNKWLSRLSPLIQDYGNNLIQKGYFRRW